MSNRLLVIVASKDELPPNMLQVISVFHFWGMTLVNAHFEDVAFVIAYIGIGMSLFAILYTSLLHYIRPHTLLISALLEVQNME